jgi:putative addiction module killer protein
MFEVRSTAEFDDWVDGLSDFAARAKIYVRVERVREGNLGDVRSVGEGLSEMRINFGPGYRVYYKQFGRSIVFLLCGGDKSTQDKDIKRAKRLAAML